jgi:predicted nucleic acid-binding protein
MPGPFTVDASVFLNAFTLREQGHDISLDFLAYLQAEAIPIIAPTLLLPEVAGAISRGHTDADLARQFAETLGQLPHLVLVSLDPALAHTAINMAARHRLRGSDAVYAAVAQRFNSPLVTLDREQGERVAAVLPVQSPGEVLETL